MDPPFLAGPFFVLEDESMRKVDDPRVTTSIKLSKSERRRIDQGAAAVGLSRSAFMRACAWAAMGAKGKHAKP